ALSPEAEGGTGAGLGSRARPGAGHRAPRLAALRYHWGEEARGAWMRKIRTAVFPVAGRGTRFLPATKASPKEMLPSADTPLIQYAVEEALAADVERLVFITGSSKRAIEDHFDTDAELERQLQESGKQDLLALVQNIVPPGVTCLYVRQGTPLGLG